MFHGHLAKCPIVGWAFISMVILFDKNVKLLPSWTIVFELFDGN
jgi:hypothetical protein